MFYLKTKNELNAKDHPSIKYLIDNNKNWDKTKIMYKACDTELNAYKLETEILNKYNLFES